MFYIETEFYGKKIKNVINKCSYFMWIMSIHIASLIKVSCIRIQWLCLTPIYFIG